MIKNIIWFISFSLFSVISYAGIELTQSPLSPGSGLPGGSDTEVQFNDGGLFGGDTGFTYLKATDALSCGTLNLSGLIQGSMLFSGASGLVSQDNINLFWDDASNRLGLGINTPSTTLHIKANAPGTVGDSPAGQIIIQALGTSVNANAVVTGYNSDGSGNPNNELWYLGSSSGSNANITFLNRIAAANLSLGTNGSTRFTILGTGDIGIGTDSPVSLLHISETIAPILTLERVDASVADPNPIGILSFLGGEDGTEEQVASITAVADEAWSDTTSGSRLVFSTTPTGATNDTERMRIDSSGNVIHTNFTKLGSDAPLIKHKKFTGTGGTAEGWTTNVAHGLGDISKIISATVLLTPPNGNIIPPGFTRTAEFQYDFLITPTNFIVQASATNSGSILVSSSFVILLTLEE